MKHFIKEHNTTQEILDQSMWLNKHITVNNKCIYWK